MTKARMILCFLVATLTTSFLWAGIPPKPSPQRLVNDYVGLLTTEQASQLEQTLIEFDKATSIQIAVVIVSSTDGESPAEYATQIGQSWGVGQKGLDNGVVFLIAKNDRKTFIATGYGIEGYLPDALASRICQQTVKPYFKDKKYWDGVQAGVTEITNILGQIPWEEREAQRKALERQDEIAVQNFLSNLFLVLVALAFVALIIVFYMKARKKQLSIERNKEVLADLRNSYEERCKSKVALDSSWPSWAQNIWSKENDNYTALQKSFTSLLAEQENDVENLEHEDGEILQTLLLKLEENDARMAKVRSDVKLYKERAPRAIKELSDMARRLQSSVATSKELGHATDRWERKLEEVRKEMEGFKVGNKEHDRDTYLRSYDLKQVLDSVEESMGLEESARNEFTTLTTKVSNMLGVVESTKSEYEKHVSGILSKYSGETITGLVTVGELMEMISKASGFISLAQKLANSREDRKYRLAKEEMERAERVTEKAIRSITLMEEITRNAEKNIAGFASAYTTVESQVQKALSEIKDSDVKEVTQETAREAMRDLKRSKASIESSKPDFVKAYRELEKATKGAELAIQNSKQDKSAAETRRANERAAKRRQKEQEEEDRKRRNQNNESSSIFSSSSYSSSSSSSDSFGGFGGGDFGGGGGGGDW